MPHVMISAKKCTGCHMCELACSAQHEGAYRPSVARLFSEVNPTTGAIKGHTCLQTACAKCQEACPEDAIVTREITVRVKGDYPGRRRRTASSSRATCSSSTKRSARTAASATTSARPGSSTSTPRGRSPSSATSATGEPQCIAFCQNPHVLAVDLKVDKMDRELQA